MKCKHTGEGTNAEIKRAIPQENVIYSLSDLFKVFGDSTRVKILSCLQVKNLCVYQIAEALDMSMSAVSHQLRVLRTAKLVKGKKDGKEVVYSLDDDHISMILECGLAHVNEKR